MSRPRSRRKKKAPPRGRKARERIGKARIVDILHDPARTAPLALVEYKDGDRRLVIAPRGAEVGQDLEASPQAKPIKGNRLPLADIPEGAKVFSVEPKPGAGGTIARSAGSACLLLKHDRNRCDLSLPSGKRKKFNPRCKATIGEPAGGGRKEKPFIKAGARWHSARAKGKKYPVTSGVAMNPVDHKFGGKGKPGVPTSISKHAPPGQKVGSIKKKK